MRMFKTVAMLAAVLALSACSMVGLGEEPKQLEIVESGLFKQGVLVRSTEGVPRELGTSFGFRFKVKDPKAGTIKAVQTTRTPGLIDPSRTKVQHDFTTELTLQPGQTYDVIFTFSEPWEMVAGKWELIVQTQKGETLSQIFDVYNPKF